MAKTPWRRLKKIERRQIIANQFPTRTNVRRVELLKENSRVKPEIFTFLGRKKHRELVGERFLQSHTQANQLVARVNPNVCLETEYFRMPESLNLTEKRMRLLKTLYSHYLAAISVNPHTRKVLRKLLFERAWLEFMRGVASEGYPIPIKQIIPAHVQFTRVLRKQIASIRKEKNNNENKARRETLQIMEDKVVKELDEMQQRLSSFKKLSTWLYDIPDTNHWWLYEKMMNYQVPLFNLLTHPQRLALHKIDKAVQEWWYTKDDLRVPRA